MKSKIVKSKSIVTIGILSMLTFSILNSIFIHETNSINKFVSNVSIENKNTETQEIKDYSIERKSNSGNSVTYNINYEEDGVWYWDQSKEDYVIRNWTKYASDKWYYGPQYDLGSSGDDQSHSGSSSYLPTFVIKYTGDRPTHNVWHEGEPDDPNTPWDDSTPGWNEVVEDDWPNPYNAFKSSSKDWRRETSYNGDYNQDYSYTWKDYFSKMNSYPKLNKKWEYVEKDNGSWNQSTYDHWHWTGTDYWKKPSRKSTSYGNEKVFVEWDIKTNGSLIDEGKEYITTYDDVVLSASEFAKTQELPTSQYSLTDSQKHSSKHPTITIPEPKDSDWYGVEGQKTFTIDNLPLGWEYLFHAKLKYVDYHGIEHTYKEFDDSFSNTKDIEYKINTWTKSNSETSITFGYEIEDPKNTRASEVNWVMTPSSGDVQKGTSESNHFEKTFKVDKGSTATFEVYYDYSLFTDSTGSLSTKTTPSEMISGETGKYYSDSVDGFDVWIDNIQDDSFVFNYYISTNNNYLESNSYIVINTKERNYTINDLQLGTKSFFVETPEGSDLDDENLDVKAELKNYEGTTLKEKDFKFNNKTNLVKDLSIRIIENIDIRNTESTINFEIDKKYFTGEIENIKYELNGNLYDLNYEDTSSVQTLELENLKPETEYNLKFIAKTKVRDYYSNNFKFKTDRNPKISLPKDNVTVGENSLALSFNVDKFEYLDEVNFKWNVIDRENNKVVYEKQQEIIGDGINTIYADGLESNHSYKVTLNALVEDKIIMLSKNIETNLVENDDINNAFINSIDKKNSIYNFKYNGKLISVQYSIDGSNWTNVNFNKKDEHNFTVSKISTNEEGFISFRLNNQMRSQISYYDGVKNTLITPKDPIDFNWNLFIIIIVILFVILTITASSIWAYFNNRKKEERFKGNIWRVSHNHKN